MINSNANYSSDVNYMWISDDWMVYLFTNSFHSAVKQFIGATTFALSPNEKSYLKVPIVCVQTKAKMPTKKKCFLIQVNLKPNQISDGKTFVLTETSYYLAIVCDVSLSDKTFGLITINDFLSNELKVDGSDWELKNIIDYIEGPTNNDVFVNVGFLDKELRMPTKYMFVPKNKQYKN